MPHACPLPTTVPHRTTRPAPLPPSFPLLPPLPAPLPKPSCPPCSCSLPQLPCSFSSSWPQPNPCSAPQWWKPTSATMHAACLGPAPTASTALQKPPNSRVWLILTGYSHYTTPWVLARQSPGPLQGPLGAPREPPEEEPERAPAGRTWSCRRVGWKGGPRREVVR